MFSVWCLWFHRFLWLFSLRIPLLKPEGGKPPVADPWGSDWSVCFSFVFFSSSFFTICVKTFSVCYCCTGGILRCRLDHGWIQVCSLKKKKELQYSIKDPLTFQFPPFFRDSSTLLCGRGALRLQSVSRRGAVRESIVRGLTSLPVRFRSDWPLQTAIAVTDCPVGTCSSMWEQNEEFVQFLQTATREKWPQF